MALVIPCVAGRDIFLDANAPSSAMAFTPVAVAAKRSTPVPRVCDVQAHSAVRGQAGVPIRPRPRGEDAGSRVAAPVAAHDIVRISHEEPVDER